MKFKSLLVFILVLVSGCGVKKEIIPRYKFEVGKDISYNLKLSADLNADMGLFIYNSKVSLKSKVILKPVEKTEYGFKIQMEITDIEAEGISNQLQTAFMVGMNSMKRILSEFEIDEYGNSRVIVNGQQVNYISYIIDAILVNLTDINQKKTFTTNIAGWIDKNTPIVSKYEASSFIKERKGNTILIYQSGALTTYSKEEFEKAVEPKAMGIAKYEINNRFDYVVGRLIDKNVNFEINYEIPVKQGFLTTYLKIKTKGDLKFISSELQL